MKQIEEEPSTKEMVKNILKQAYPTIVALIFVQMVETISIAFIGNLGSTLLLASVAIGNMLIYVSNQTIVYGFNLALCEYVPESFGKGEIRKCGLQLNRGRIAIFLI
jgi:Na+-driven multidrug efflux pump